MDTTNTDAPNVLPLSDRPVNDFDFTVEDDLNDMYQTTYMKYNAVHLIPGYFTEAIFEDIESFVDLNNRDIIELIKLMRKGKDELAAFSTAIITHIERAGTYERVHKQNKGDLAALTWIKKTKMFVEPVEQVLPDGEKFHYIPILKNIKALLNNKEIHVEYFKEKEVSDECVIDCFEKSDTFKRWLKHGLNKHSVQIKLFIDAFTTTNVLGNVISM